VKNLTSSCIFGSLQLAVYLMQPVLKEKNGPDWLLMPLSSITLSEKMLISSWFDTETVKIFQGSQKARV